MRVLLLGAQSQLGHDILRTWPENTVTALGHGDCDVTDPEAVREAITASTPELVVNLAASHRVDAIERDPADAFRVNAYGSWNVAREAARAGAGVMWVSTDYVFSGGDGRPYVEQDRPAPVNAYGASKAAGEALIEAANPRAYIVRSSGLYGVAGASGKGGNFVETMLRLAREGAPLRVVDDQVLGPTSTFDLARAMLQLARSESFGVTHLTNAGEISWFQFAVQILKSCGTATPVLPVRSAEYGAPAPRPEYSVLANRKLLEIGIDPLPPIDDALKRYLREKGHTG